MRFDGQLLTEAESLKLIDEINAWCRRTGTNYNKLVTAAGVAPNTRSSVRYRGRCVTIMTADKLRATMAKHRHGISKAEHRARTSRAEVTAFERATVRLREEFPQAEAPRVDRTPCPRCGVRADKHAELGCSLDFERATTAGYVRRYG